MAEQTTITVEYIATRFVSPEVKDDGLQWGIFRFIHSSGEIVGKGSIESTILNPGAKLELVGAWENDRKYGQQFAFRNYSLCQPNGRWGTIAFLMCAEGIGETIGGRIYDAYAEDTIEAITMRPDEVSAKVPGLRSEVAQAAADTLLPLIEGSKLKLPLLTLFKGTKLAAKTADRVIAARIPNPVEAISANPFLLMEFPGIAFKQCDSLRMKLKLAVDMPERILAACVQTFDDDSDQTWLTTKDILKGMGNLLEIEGFDVLLVLNELIAAGKIIRSDCGEWYGQKQQVEDEAFVARTLDRMMAADVPDHVLKALVNVDPNMQQFTVGDGGEPLTQHQFEVLKHNIQAGGRVLVLPGSPGTGKTFTLAKFLKALGHQYLAACAPTGKAAQRLAQTIKTLPVTTIHRLLGPRPIASGGFEFSIRDHNLPVGAVAVDETSMVNNWLAARLFEAMPRDGYLILVGDQNQLPPIGPGTMLRDLQATGRYRELTEIKRNAGMIVKSCASIRDKQVPRFHITPKPGIFDTAEKNVHMIAVPKDERKAEKLDEIVLRVLCGEIMVPTKDGMRGADPIHDVQFITATHKNQHVGREVLNAKLQKAFNRRMEGEHAKFKIGDKVICTENCFLMTHVEDLEESRKVFVANGELGRVIYSYEKRMVVELTSSGERVMVPCGAENGGWDLGYCITTHKSQGSEWPVVIVCMGSDYGSEMVMSREWLYTAISRAKYQCVVLASHDQISKQVRKVRLGDRRSKMPTIWEESNGETTGPKVDPDRGQQGADPLDF